MGLKIGVVKTLNVFILGNIFFFIGTAVSKLFLKYLIKPYEEKETKTHNIMRLVIEIGTICMSVYLIRLLIKFLNASPYHPLRGVWGFNPINVLELKGGVVLSFAFLMYVKKPIFNKIDRILEFYKNN